MCPHAMAAKHIENYSVWVRFDDGTEGDIDLSDTFDGEMFLRLRDPDYFAQFSIEGNTLAWPNGADYAPEFLYERLKCRVQV